MATLWLRNLGFYSLQILLIAAAGGLLLHALSIRIPKARLICWQALLMACLLLPAVQPWRRLSIDSSVQITTGAFTAVERNHSLGFLQIPLPNIMLLLGAGAAIRFSILGLGFWRLRRYRRDSSIVPGAFHDLERRMGVHADVHVSSDAPGPVTFGFLRPMILLPQACLQDESIACHELLHVRRHDWLFTVLEECVLALFWFHPAMWWLMARIQLAREEAVRPGGSDDLELARAVPGVTAGARHGQGWNGFSSGVSVPAAAPFTEKGCFTIEGGFHV